MKLPKMVYLVYEAKKNAEKVASVGKMTTLRSYNAKGLSKFMNAEGQRQFDSLYQKFGPQKITEPIPFPDAFFYQP